MKVGIPEGEGIILFQPASSITPKLSDGTDSRAKYSTKMQINGSWGARGRAVFSVARCVSVEEEFMDEQQIPPRW